MVLGLPITMSAVLKVIWLQQLMGPSVFAADILEYDASMWVVVYQGISFSLTALRYLNLKDEKNV